MIPCDHCGERAIHHLTTTTRIPETHDDVERGRTYHWCSKHNPHPTPAHVSRIVIDDPTSVAPLDRVRRMFRLDAAATEYALAHAAYSGALRGKRFRAAEVLADPELRELSCTRTMTHAAEVVLTAHEAKLRAETRLLALALGEKRGAL